MGASCSAGHRLAAGQPFQEFVASADVGALTYLLTGLAWSFATARLHQRAGIANDIDQVCAAITAHVSGPKSDVAAAAFIHASGLNAVADVVEVRGLLLSETPSSVMRLLASVLGRAEAPWHSPPSPQQWVRLANSLLKAEPLVWIANVPINTVFAGLSFFCHEVREMHALCEWAAARHAQARVSNYESGELHLAACKLVTNLLSASHASSRRHAWTFERTGTLGRMATTLHCVTSRCAQEAAASGLRRALACFNAPANGDAHNDLCAHWTSTGFVDRLQRYRYLLDRCREGIELLDDVARCTAANNRIAKANAAAEQAKAEAQMRARAEEAVAQAKAAAIAAAASGMHVKAEDVDICLAQVVTPTDNVRALGAE
jgi:hypothetical protein